MWVVDMPLSFPSTPHLSLKLWLAVLVLLIQRKDARGTIESTAGQEPPARRNVQASALVIVRLYDAGRLPGPQIHAPDRAVAVARNDLVLALEAQAEDWAGAVYAHASTLARVATQIPKLHGVVGATCADEVGVKRRESAAVDGLCVAFKGSDW